MGWREQLMRRTSSSAQKWVVQVPRNINVDALPDQSLSPIILPPSFDATSKGCFVRFLEAFYLRRHVAAAAAIDDGLQHASPKSQEALWFLIAKSVLRLDRGYVEPLAELDAVLDDHGLPEDEVNIIWALRGFNKNQELLLRGAQEATLDAEQEKVKARFSNYLATISDLYDKYSAPDVVCNEVQTLFRIIYHRYLVREHPSASRMHALAFELAAEEPRQYLRFCDDLLKQGRIDLFLHNIRFRGRSVAGVGPRPIHERLQQCAGQVKSKNQLALCRYLMIRNTDHIFDDTRDGPDRRFPEYFTCSPIFRAVGNVVDDTSCQLYLVSVLPTEDRLTKATELRQQFQEHGYPGLVLECLLEVEVPLCMSPDISKQMVLSDALIQRLREAAKVEAELVGPRNAFRRLYDNLLGWMSLAKNVYTLAVLVEFTETLWAKAEPAQYQAITLSDRISSSHELITKTLYGRYPCSRLVDLCFESAWRFLGYARMWKDSNVISTAMSRMLYWQVAQASFSPTIRHLVPRLAEAEELAILSIDKDRDEVRFMELIEKCAIITQIAMLHPARARSAEDVEFFRLARSLERRVGPEAVELLDNVAEDFKLADRGDRRVPMSVEQRAQNLSPEKYAAWKAKAKEDVPFQAFAAQLQDKLHAVEF